MASKVLFLGSGSPFMMNVLKSGLIKAGYDVAEVEPEPTAIRSMGADRDLMVLFLGAALLARPRRWKR